MSAAIAAVAKAVKAAAPSISFFIAFPIHFSREINQHIGFNLVASRRSGSRVVTNVT
jgi:hypothetical protein